MKLFDKFSCTNQLDVAALMSFLSFDLLTTNIMKV